MSPFRRTIVPVVLLALLAGACTGGGDEEPSTQPTSASCAPGECVIKTDTGDITYQPGQYEYTFNGVTATFSLVGATGTLEVKNGSPAEIESASYTQTSLSVRLGLAEGALRAGDAVRVQWTNLSDSDRRSVADGQATVTAK